MGLMTSMGMGGRMLATVCIATLSVGCMGGDDSGGGGGNTTAGVSGNTLAGELTQEEITSLCMHFDDKFADFDDSYGCCVGTAVGSQMNPESDPCEDVLAACQADPASFDCQSDAMPDDCTDPPPTNSMER